MSLESYEILGIDPNSTFPEIRQAFRHMALLCHPDKGGNPRLFMIVQNAYKDILYTLESKNRHQHHNMKQDFKETYSKQKKSKGPPIIDPQNFNNKKFNQIFERYRVPDPSDNGYDLSEEITVSAEQYETAVTQYECPDIIACSKGYTNLGQSKIDDYTAPLYSKVKYTDAQRAYATPTQEDRLHTRPEYTSMKQLRSERKSMKMEANEEEQRRYQEIQKKKLELEKIRQRNHRKQLERGQRIGDQMRNFLQLN